MKAFCDYCYELVNYTVNTTEINKNIKGQKYSFIGKIATCNICNHSVAVESVSDYNLELLNNLYRKENKLISIEDIQSILDKYNIGKRPLSLALGWGEHTIDRYLNGDIPNKKYSDILKSILDNPEELYEYINENKNLITNSAYTKAELKILEHLSIDLDPTNKIECVVYYILSKSKDITPLALQKLLYYIDGFSQSIMQVKIFPDTCEAWVHGPVYSDVYHKFKNYGYQSIVTNYFYLDSINLNVDEKNIIDCVIDNFGCYSGKILERMTHTEEPWLITRDNLEPDQSCNNTIDNELVVDYFTKIIDEYNISIVDDISLYSQSTFEKIKPTNN